MQQSAEIVISASAEHTDELFKWVGEEEIAQWLRSEMNSIFERTNVNKQSEIEAGSKD